MEGVPETNVCPGVSKIISTPYVTIALNWHLTGPPAMSGCVFVVYVNMVAPYCTVVGGREGCVSVIETLPGVGIYGLRKLQQTLRTCAKRVGVSQFTVTLAPVDTR
jgi:hypothetical protein